MTEKEVLISYVRNKLMAFTILLSKLESDPSTKTKYSRDILLANKGIAKILEM